VFCKLRAPRMPFAQTELLRFAASITMLRAGLQPIAAVWCTSKQLILRISQEQGHLVSMASVFT
jgi:hypothetical protein